MADGIELASRRMVQRWFNTYRAPSIDAIWEHLPARVRWDRLNHILVLGESYRQRVLEE